VLHGSGTRHVGNNFSSYENGDLVFMGPNLPHAGFGLNAHGMHEEIVVQIKEDVFKESILSRPEMSMVSSLIERAKCGVVFYGATKEKVTKRFKKLPALSVFERYIELLHSLQLMATSNEYELLNPNTTLSLLLKKNNSRLQNILSYVQQHYNEDVDIQKVAAIANLSVPSFCNYFKKLMNCTFTKFINQYRIQRACVLMLQEKTITEICYDSGFNNVVYFNKVFKAIMKKTPSEYKKEKQQGLMKAIA
jgi:AraC-like DNA-binding protein